MKEITNIEKGQIVGGVCLCYVRGSGMMMPVEVKAESSGHCQAKCCNETSNAASWQYGGVSSRIRKCR